MEKKGKLIKNNNAQLSLCITPPRSEAFFHRESS